MKNRLFMQVSVGMLTFMLITACGAKETAAEEIIEAETIEAETAESSVWEISEEYDSYLSWTSKEWAQAGEDNKKKVCIAYAAYVSEVTGIASAGKTTETLELPEMAEQLQGLLSTVDDLFAIEEAEGLTLKELADMGIGQLLQQ